jgi:CBS domain containing-hemolysin-like protein
MTPPYFIDEKSMIDDLLTEMRQKKIQMAMVQDKNKNVVGLVTIEDVLEELVGEIWDEEDIVDQNFQALGGNKYMVNTRMLMGSAFERIGEGNIPKHLISKPIISFILETLGHIPSEDESFIYENFEVTAKTIENGTVTEVIIHLLDEEDLLELKQAEESEGGAE